MYIYIYMYTYKDSIEMDTLVICEEGGKMSETKRKKNKVKGKSI